MADKEFAKKVNDKAQELRELLETVKNQDYYFSLTFINNSQQKDASGTYLHMMFKDYLVDPEEVLNESKYINYYNGVCDDNLFIVYSNEFVEKGNQE